MKLGFIKLLSAFFLNLNPNPYYSLTLPYYYYERERGERSFIKIKRGFSLVSAKGKLRI
jgi:hypothetical protein